jgi:hypothetical protein
MADRVDIDLNQVSILQSEVLPNWARYHNSSVLPNWDSDFHNV